MRTLFTFGFISLVFGFLFLPVSADFICSGTSQTFTGDDAQTQCQGNCPNGSCDTVSSGDSNSSGSSGSSFTNPINSDSFEALVLSLAQWVAAIALPIAAIFIIYSGYLFVTAGGNQSKIDAAKTTFYWTIIGTAIVVGAWALAAAIVDFAQKL
jgi:hypothetical protein